jgi:hypothetical protein
MPNADLALPTLHDYSDLPATDIIRVTSGGNASSVGITNAGSIRQHRSRSARWKLIGNDAHGFTIYHPLIHAPEMAVPARCRLFTRSPPAGCR